MKRVHEESHFKRVRQHFWRHKFYFHIFKIKKYYFLEHLSLQTQTLEIVLDAGPSLSLQCRWQPLIFFLLSSFYFSFFFSSVVIQFFSQFVSVFLEFCLNFFSKLISGFTFMPLPSLIPFLSHLFTPIQPKIYNFSLVSFPQPTSYLFLHFSILHIPSHHFVMLSST